ncbi:hypothetical protein LA6_003345 [Marinibacterium anthonyi]|nr:hypothetical protein LA6_003345 [Marinibacterium anthonyi]
MKNALAILLCALPALGLADVAGPGGKVIDCYCTDRSGGRIELGEMICLRVDGKAFMAQCQMSLNVPMWRKIQDGCLTARLSPFGSQPGDPAVDPGPVHAQVRPAKAQTPIYLQQVTVLARRGVIGKSPEL